MNKKLNQEKKKFEKEGYSKKAIPEILQYLKDYKKTGKYPDSEAVAGYIKKRENISENLDRHLLTEIYLANQDLKEEIYQEKKKKMLKDGYLSLSDIGDFTGQCLLSGIKNISWLSLKMEEIGKIIKTDSGDSFFIPKGKRTRGYYCQNITDGFYKPL